MKLNEFLNWMLQIICELVLGLHQLEGASHVAFWFTGKKLRLKLQIFHLGLVLPTNADVAFDFYHVRNNFGDD